eukprot:COSAG02_NODE_25949_length_644_cov_1.834862_1_plen_81_part_10
MRAAVIPRIHDTTNGMNRDFSVVSQYSGSCINQSMSRINRCGARARPPRATPRARARDDAFSSPLLLDEMAWLNMHYDPLP